MQNLFKIYYATIANSCKAFEDEVIAIVVCIIVILGGILQGDYVVAAASGVGIGIVVIVIVVKRMRARRRARTRARTRAAGTIDTK